MRWLRRLHSGQLVILWAVGAVLHFFILSSFGMIGGKDGLTGLLVSNLEGIDSLQTATVDASLLLERDWLLAQYPDQEWEKILLAQARCRFGGRLPEWYVCRAGARVPEVEARIPEPDLDLGALVLLASVGALVPIGLFAVTVLWCLSSPFPVWGSGPLLGFWLGGMATVTLALLGWVVLTSETSERFSTLSGRIFFPAVAFTAVVAFLLLRLTWRWFGARNPKSPAL